MYNVVYVDDFKNTHVATVDKTILDLLYDRYKIISCIAG